MATEKERLERMEERLYGLINKSACVAHTSYTEKLVYWDDFRLGRYGFDFNVREVEAIQGNVITLDWVTKVEGEGEVEQVGYGTTIRRIYELVQQDFGQSILRREAEMLWDAASRNKLVWTNNGLHMAQGYSPRLCIRPIYAMWSRVLNCPLGIRKMKIRRGEKSALYPPVRGDTPLPTIREWVKTDFGVSIDEDAARCIREAAENGELAWRTHLLATMDNKLRILRAERTFSRCPYIKEREIRNGWWV